MTLFISYAYVSGKWGANYSLGCCLYKDGGTLDDIIYDLKKHLCAEQLTLLNIQELSDCMAKMLKGEKDSVDYDRPSGIDDRFCNGLTGTSGRADKVAKAVAEGLKKK